MHLTEPTVQHVGRMDKRERAYDERQNGRTGENAADD
jgi:hypothetical protein